MADLYALLIGIDFYEPNPYYNSLQGAVRDIDKVADYLEKSLQIPSERITRLTSPLQETNILADVRSARQEMPPTYQNIVNAFNKVTETAQAKDLVYIHYSGHGGRGKSIFPFKKEEYDESLVPMDVGDEGYYLRDVEIATLLKRMTDKGLIVTVIFDSCHAGGATRGDGAIRGSIDGKLDNNKRPEDSAVASLEELKENWLGLTQGSKKEGWLPNLRDYVFLGACRPSELAHESVFGEARERNGALTYWMFDTLTAVGTNLTYQALYERVKGKIQSEFSDQLPMLLGEGDRLVFGSEVKATQYTLTTLKVEKDEVTLEGGLAQGLSRGMRFSLYPVGSDFSDPQKRLAVIEIIDLQASTSTARILTEQESGISVDKKELDAGLPAMMESAPLDLKRRVRFYLKEVGERENQLPADLAQKQTAALEQVRQAMQGNGWVTEVQANEEGHYQVAVGRAGEYEICGGGTPIKNLTPALSIDDPDHPDTPAEVVKRLVHLSKYQSALMLDNPCSELAQSIEYQLLDIDTKQPLDPNNISLKSGDRVYVRIKNCASEPLNVAVLDFEPTWKISQIPVKGIQAAFYALQPGDEVKTRIKFRISDEAIYRQAKETLKLFVARGAANFQWLLLPSLDKQNDEKYLSMRGSLKGSMRSGEISSPLNQLLSTIGADEPPSVMRSADYDPDPNAEWLTKEIVITVRL